MSSIIRDLTQPKQNVPSGSRMDDPFWVPHFPPKVLDIARMSLPKSGSQSDGRWPAAGMAQGQEFDPSQFYPAPGGIEGTAQRYAAARAKMAGLAGPNPSPGAQAQMDLMAADQKRFEEYDARQPERHAKVDAERQAAADAREAQAAAADAEIHKPGISSHDPDWRAKHSKWVGESVDRQAKYDPQGNAERIAKSVADHIRFDKETLARTGKFPEEIQHANIPDHIKRKQYIKEMAVRYKDELASGSMTIQDLLADSPYAATGKGPSDTRLMADAMRQGQRATNVQRNWDQINMGRQLGVSRGHVIAMQDVQQHLAKGDKAGAAAKMAMYGIGGDTPKAMLAAEAAEAEAKAKIKPPEPGPIESLRTAQKQVGAMPAGPQRLSAMRMVHVQALGGKDAPQEQVEMAVRGEYQPYAQEMVARGIDQLSPEERIEFQQATAGMDYQSWLKYVGKGDSPEMRQAYSGLHNKNATWSDFGSNIVDWMVPDGLWNSVFGG